MDLEMDLSINIQGRVGISIFHGKFECGVKRAKICHKEIEVLFTNI